MFFSGTRRPWDLFRALRRPTFSCRRQRPLGSRQPARCGPSARRLRALRLGVGLDRLGDDAVQGDVFAQLAHPLARQAVGSLGVPMGSSTLSRMTLPGRPRPSLCGISDASGVSISFLLAAISSRPDAGFSGPVVAELPSQPAIIFPVLIACRVSSIRSESLGQVGSPRPEFPLTGYQAAQTDPSFFDAFGQIAGQVGIASLPRFFLTGYQAARKVTPHSIVQSRWSFR